MLQAAMEAEKSHWGIPNAPRSPGLGSGSRHELDIESDGHLVINQNAVGLEGNVPSQTEILPL
jgi:hypothetical protein